jgi:hypothetical protein
MIYTIEGLMKVTEHPCCNLMFIHGFQYIIHERENCLIGGKKIPKAKLTGS